MGLARRGGAQGRGREGGGRLKGRGEKEKPSAAQLGAGAQPLGGSYRVGVCQGGLLSVCVYVGGGQEERQRRRESYPGTPEQFVTLEWLLSYPGGPLIAGEFSGRRVGNREGLGAAERGQRSWPTQAQAVRPLAGQTGGWRERKEAKKGVVGKPGACQGSVFLGMLVKPAGEISV